MSLDFPILSLLTFAPLVGVVRSMKSNTLPSCRPYRATRSTLKPGVKYTAATF